MSLSSRTHSLARYLPSEGVHYSDHCVCCYPAFQVASAAAMGHTRWRLWRRLMRWWLLSCRAVTCQPSWATKRTCECVCVGRVLDLLIAPVCLWWMSCCYCCYCSDKHKYSAWKRLTGLETCTPKHTHKQTGVWRGVTALLALLLNPHRPSFLLLCVTVTSSLTLSLRHTLAQIQQACCVVPRCCWPHPHTHQSSRDTG